MGEEKKIIKWRCPICGEVFTSRTTEEMEKHWECVSNYTLGTALNVDEKIIDMRDAQESYLKMKPCNRICRRFEFEPNECRKCEYNEIINPLAKQFREKGEAERKAWEGQQGAL